MTDERAPDGASTPSSDPPSTGGGWDAATTATPPPASAGWDAPTTAAPPRPLAPLAAAAASAPTTPQPAVAWETPAPASVTAGGRTALAAVAGILLLVLGGLGILIGVLFMGSAGYMDELAASGAFDDIPGMPAGFESAVGGMVTVVGVILIVYSILYVLGGVGVLLTRSWGRVIGIIVGIISGLIWLAGIGSVTSVNYGNASPNLMLFVVILFAIHLFIAIVLGIRWRTRIAVA